MRRTTVLLITCACVSNWKSIARFADEPGIRAPSVGLAHRLWAEGDRLFIEVEQRPGGAVPLIESDSRSDGLYLLIPVGTSSGSGGQTVLEVALDLHKLPPDWRERVYWVTSTEPPRRVRASVGPPALRRPSMACPPEFHGDCGPPERQAR